jgi:hypothetical protein
MVRSPGFALVPFAIALSTTAGLATLGCAGPAGEGAQGAAELSGLPAWDERGRELFDDNIDAAAVGLTMEGPSPRADRHLRERAQTADMVARLRVNTVTIDSVGEESTYHLGVQIGYPPLATPRLSDRTFELNIRSNSRAYGVARAFDARLRGLTFIGFLRRFAGEVGESEIHWHLSPDTAEVAAAVQEALALGELSAP